MKKRINIAIVDDHTLFREGIQLLIRSEIKNACIDEYCNGNDFLLSLNKVIPDIVIMDLFMPALSGLETSDIAIKKKPRLKILILTMQCSKEDYEKIIDIGVLGIILKTADKRDLLTGIHKVLNGEKYYCGDILKKVVFEFMRTSDYEKTDKANDSLITQKELEILNLYSKGHSTLDISGILKKSKKTIEYHRTNLLRKTNTKNTVDLVLFAIKNNIIKIN